jgi:hypothetical protein
MRRASASRASTPLWLAIGAGLISTGCPLSDNYYLKSESSENPDGSVNSVGGASSPGNTSTGGLSGATATGGTSAVDCSAATCNGTCCSNMCIDTQTDSANCGQCGNLCPGQRVCIGGTCHGWAPMAAPPSSFVGRQKAAYCAMGNKLFIFGGLDAQGNMLNSAAIYDPATDSWSTLSQTASNLPTKRQLASAAWSGTNVYVVFGGNAGSTAALTDGGQYNPTTDTWTALPIIYGGGIAPWLASASSYLLVWSGIPVTNGAPNALGGLLNYPSGSSGAMSWTFPTFTVTPLAVTDGAWAYSSKVAYYFGGQVNGTTKTQLSYSFSFTTSTWSQLPTTNGPSARWGAFAVSDGTSLYVWGGRDETTAMNDGHTYNTVWADISATGAPSARWAPNRNTGWAFALATGSIAIIGGLDLTGNPLTDGAIFTQATGTWSSISPWPSREPHKYGVAAVVGGEIFIWGGFDGTAPSATGERYLP